MKRWMAVGMAALAWCTAYANDKPAMAPPPAWVRTRPVPADDGHADHAAVRLLRLDLQAAFARTGLTVYKEVAVKIQTPQGLAAGNLNVAWNPELQTLTLHKFAIMRAGQTIDVLARQSFTVLRREVNLEAATLDGTLTAALEPEGVQVGDIIDVAYSVTYHDPALGGHVEGVLAYPAEIPVGEAALATHWPAAIPMRWHAWAGLPAILERPRGGDRDAGFAPAPLSPMILPKGAPARYGIVRQVEFTDLSSWSDAAAILAPIYARAAILKPGGKLAAEAARIAGSTTDPRARAAAALTLVQDQVRYLADPLGDGANVPAAADLSWERRYGDCKGKTVMLLGLLHALGIDAVPVLVSTTGGDGLDQRLPMLGVFDHVIVRATIDGRVYWLDGTRQGDHELEALETPAFHWGLPLLPKGASLVPIMPTMPSEPYVSTSLRLDARGGIDQPAAAHVVATLRGDEATAWRYGIDNLSPERRDATLRQYWHDRYAFITPSTVDARYDRTARAEILTLDGSAKMDWSGGGYQSDEVGIGYSADFTRQPGPDRDAPFAVPFPTFARTTETIVLPVSNTRYVGRGTAFDKTIAGIAYHRTVAFKDGIVTLELTARSVAPEFPASEAAADQTMLTALSREAVVVPPPARTGTPMIGSASPTDNALESAHRLLDAGRYADAAQAFDAIIKANPGSAPAYVGRGTSYAGLDRRAESRADLDRAANLAPRNLWVLGVRGEQALRTGDRDQAIADAATMLAIAPDDPHGYQLRATVEAAGGASEKAVADAQHAIGLKPGDVDLYRWLAQLWSDKGNSSEALALAGRLIAANPDNDRAHIVAGAIYGRFGHTVEAMREFDRALAIKPSASVYLNRLNYRGSDDFAGRQADIDAARKIEPDNPFVADQQWRLDEQTGHYDHAIATLTALLRLKPNDGRLLAERGVDYARTGRNALSAADFAAARKATSDPVSLNGMCWRKATANVALASALADCDASLAAAPGSAETLDSRGFVLVRLGRWDEAITAYDHALAVRPQQAASLYGRSLARAGRGDASGASADRMAALKVDPAIEKRLPAMAASSRGPPARPAERLFGNPTMPAERVFKRSLRAPLPPPTRSPTCRA